MIRWPGAPLPRKSRWGSSRLPAADRFFLYLLRKSRKGGCRTVTEEMLFLKDVTAGYGDRDVLCGISVSVVRGEFAALIGSNGAGKSTLLRCVSGLMQLQGGEIRICGKSTAAMRPKERAQAGGGGTPVLCGGIRFYGGRRGRPWDAIPIRASAKGKARKMQQPSGMPWRSPVPWNSGNGCTTS